MKTIQEIAQELTQKQLNNRNEKNSSSDKQGFFNGLADLLKDIADYTVEELKHDNKVEVTNHPEPVKEVKVSNFRGIFGILESILKSVRSFKLPNIFKVEGEVTVKNQVSIPEVKIPEYPKEIDANVDFSDVIQKIDDLQKTLSDIELNPKIEVKNESPKVQIDLESVKSRLESIVAEIKRIQVTPEVNIDIEEIKKASNETTEAIKGLRFPVPNYQSSWEHSPEMKSNDCANTIVYTTVNSKKVVGYMEFNYNGTSYRKTYYYDTNGDCTGWTGWVEQ